MPQTHEYILPVAAVAEHYALSRRTIRDHLRNGILRGVRVGGEWRCSWHEVWAAEQGPLPRGKRADLYKRPLLTKKALAAKWSVSERQVERWIAAGLPTRNVSGSVRIAPVDADDWTQRQFGIGGCAA